MKNKKPLYTLNPYKMYCRKDNSGYEKAITDDVSTKSILMLCFYLVKFLKENDGVIINKFDRLNK